MRGHSSQPPFTANKQMPPHHLSVAEPMDACHRNTPDDVDQWLSCVTLRSVLLSLLSYNMQELNSLKEPTFIVVVFHSDDSSPSGTCVVSDGFGIQWFDCEGVNDPDGDPLWKFS